VKDLLFSHNNHSVFSGVLRTKSLSNQRSAMI